MSIWICCCVRTSKRLHHPSGISDKTNAFCREIQVFYFSIMLLTTCSWQSASLVRLPVMQSMLAVWTFWYQIFIFYRPQRSCEGYVFTGVCLSTARGVPGPGGGCLVLGGVPGPEGSAPRGLCSGGCLVLGGCLPACTEADPRERWLLLRTVRIQLECILVKF